MPWDRFDRLSSDNGPHSLSICSTNPTLPYLKLPHPTLPRPNPNSHLEGLLLQQGGQAEAGGDLLDDLHDHEVLVDLRRHGSEQRRELVLVRRNL